MSTFKYFCGDVELRDVFYIKTDRFLKIGGVPSKHNRVDSFSRMIGIPADAPLAWLPVTRKIEYKDYPSLHKCDGRCMSAKGPVCECSCGGKNHGINA